MTRHGLRGTRLRFRIATIHAAIALSLAAAAFSPAARAQDSDAKCRAEQLQAKLSSGVIPDMIGCALEPTLVVLRRNDHIPSTEATSGPPPAGTIVAQTPPADTARRTDTRMTLNYSDGTAAASSFEPGLS